MTDEMSLAGLDAPLEPVTFEPTRAAGLARLDKFATRCGRHYARRRNYDFGPDRRENVSALSPWIRHRLVTEEDVLRSTLARHSFSASEKFVQEVFWRTYFKGWLEQHPSVWRAYQSGVQDALRRLDATPGLSSDYADAVEGRTGIACFDHWAHELVETGYLHNHTRMWFASIWIFTLRLPWHLGADFFLRHLMDGDPASNTLSWRWVGGLHTKGKTYLARPSNIETYTEGRFCPVNQLSAVAPPLGEDETHARQMVQPADQLPDTPFLLLVTEEDASIADWLARAPVHVVGAVAVQDRSPLSVGSRAEVFASGAVSDALKRAGGNTVLQHEDWAERLIAIAQSAGVTDIVTPWAPVGPMNDRLSTAHPILSQAGLSLHRVRRRYDTISWPHASRGFFALRKKIPQILQELGLTDTR